MPTPHCYWINGTVKVNNSLSLIGADVDGPVKVEIITKQISHAGSAPTDVITDEVAVGAQVSLPGTVFTPAQLEHLAGMTKTTGTLQDAVTPADLYTLTGQTGQGQRPYVDLLITGHKVKEDGTTYDVEIHIPRAKLMGNLPWSMDKDNHSKNEFMFKAHGDPDDTTATIIQIRDDELTS